MAGRRAAATAELIEQMLTRFQQSGLSRREYCEREGIAVTTLYYYQRRLRELRNREGPAETSSCAAPAPVWARVDLQPGGGNGASNRCAVALGNGRRIELAGWDYPEAAMARLIRLVERA